ncbi:MAG TPA: response regulator [Candidatus Binatia bacterium]
MLSFGLGHDDECFRAVNNKILIVDDDAAVRKLLVLRLQQSGYDTIEAVTNHEAINQARATRPNIILMELAMLGDTAGEAIALLKADPLTRDIPVIAVAASLHGVLVDRAIAAGAAEILYKPVNWKWLDLVLQRHLSYQAPSISKI